MVFYIVYSPKHQGYAPTWSTSGNLNSKEVKLSCLIFMSLKKHQVHKMRLVSHLQR